MASTILADNGVSSGSAGIKTSADSTGVLALQTTTAGGAATTAVTIDTSQNVGVGVTPSAWGSGYKAMQLGSQAAFVGYSGNYAWLSTNSLFGASSTTYIANGYATTYRQNDGTHAWLTAGSGTAGNAISFTQAMTLDASGNLGLATSSPVALSGVGSTLTINKNSNDAIFIRSAETNNSTLAFGISTSAAITYLQSNASGSGSVLPFAFYVGNTERARIDSSGRWLVNATSAALSASKAQISYSPSADYGLVLYPTNTTYNNASVLFLNNAGTSVGYIYSTGSATTYSTTSDYRLKENIAPMTGALEKVAALKPCTYTWKADGSVSQGFIAHELQAVVSEAVVGEKDAVDEDGNPKYQGIDTSFLVATLTAAIQEQQTLIQTLTSRITALEAK